MCLDEASDGLKAGWIVKLLDGRIIEWLDGWKTGWVPKKMDNWVGSGRLGEWTNGGMAVSYKKVKNSFDVHADGAKDTFCTGTLDIGKPDLLPGK
ncbi:hypothetical protein EVAR_42101_1 [Eumeta japonica]|uniref:Uncharacterized protein n=1 Tax=Eumeta variegata TaxID=151549 RepID=A0A4C1XJA8_EUMVA|nr:hypothetical protein EVAR_42101_1 [Eumeta japonica]